MQRRDFCGIVLELVLSGSALAGDDTSTSARAWHLRGTHIVHGWRCTSVAFSPDGRWLATVGGLDVGDAAIWDVKTGNRVATWEVHPEHTKAVVFSPDGKTLATGGGHWNGPGEVALWNAATQKRSSTLQVRETGVLALAFSPDGKTMAVGGGHFREGYHGGVILCDVSRGLESGTSLQGHVGEVTSLAFSADGKILLTSTLLSDPQMNRNLWELKTWDARTGQEQMTIETSREQAPDAQFFHIWQMAVSRDGTKLAGGGRSGNAGIVKVWDLATGGTVSSLEHKGAVYSLAFDPDGRTLATADSGTGTIRFWDLTQNKELPSLVSFSGAAFALAFSLDGKHLIAAGTEAAADGSNPIGTVAWWVRD